MDLRNVFVYGTLKMDEPCHYWIENEDTGYANFICYAETASKFPLVIASRYNMPFLLDVPGLGHHIFGEVYEIDFPKLVHLDMFKQHPDLYFRSMIDVICIGDEVLTAWVYQLLVFRPYLLELPFLQYYSAYDHRDTPYIDPTERDPDFDIRSELQY